MLCVQAANSTSSQPTIREVDTRGSQRDCPPACLLRPLTQKHKSDPFIPALQELEANPNAVCPTCPICKKSLGDYSAHWREIDRQASSTCSAHVSARTCAVSGELAAAAVPCHRQHLLLVWNPIDLNLAGGAAAGATQVASHAAPVSTWV